MVDVVWKYSHFSIGLNRACVILGQAVSLIFELIVVKVGVSKGGTQVSIIVGA